MQILPEISKWDTFSVTNMSHLFHQNSYFIRRAPRRWKFKITNNSRYNLYNDFNYKHFSSLPDISKWNTSSVTNMSNMFYNCSGLQNLPDISKWNISKVKDISYMFYKCYNLKSLPDISKWNVVLLKI